MTRRHKREQSTNKEKLTDILEDIDIEEIPVEQSTEVTPTETKKKSKRAKKLYFIEEEHGFIFRPRKHVTRSMWQVEEIPEAPLDKTGSSKKPSKKRKGKEALQEKIEIKALQE